MGCAVRVARGVSLTLAMTRPGPLPRTRGRSGDPFLIPLACCCVLRRRRAKPRAARLPFSGVEARSAFPSLQGLLHRATQEAGEAGHPRTRPSGRGYLRPWASSLWTWIALIPSVLPVQAARSGGSACWTVELMVEGPGFQRNRAPGVKPPPIDADLTSGFQLGHALTEVNRSQTVAASAAISVSLWATTGAVLSTSI